MADMVCDNCGSTDAVVHLTQIINNEMSTHHLCEQCATEKGLETTPDVSDVPLIEVIAQMTDDDAPGVGTAETECSFCGLTFADFRRTGRLGCPHCYETFGEQLPRLLRRIHGGVKHVGKVYLPPDPTASELEKRLEGLRRGLDRAVHDEDFERAAELRDEIRSLEPA
ncbi:MAG: UvrB/UvrC motif-containing protein [Gemmatimonadetes bacterium]|nr:UvrB/UvrC motif-containing protein [Gemmatimonadota bacterium]